MAIILPTVSLVHSNSNSVSAASINVTWGGTPAEGNLLVAMIENTGGVTPTAAGWSLGPTLTFNGATQTHSLLYKRALAGEATSVTFASAGATQMDAHIWEYNGLGAAVIDKSNTTADSGSNVTARATGATGTLATAGDVIFASVAVSGAISAFGWTPNTFGNGFNTARLSSGTLIASANTSQNESGGWTTSRRACGLICAFAPAAPVVASISPTVGPPNARTFVTITGSGFASGAAVSIGGVPCNNVTVLSPTTITCYTSVNNGQGVGTVTVTDLFGQSGSLANAFSFRTLKLTSISPTFGIVSGGTKVALRGVGFTQGATVTIGGIALTKVVVSKDGQLLTGVTGVHAAGTVKCDVVVTNTGTGTFTATLTNGFIYYSLPTLSAISPSSGSIGGNTDVHTLTGTRFLTEHLANVQVQQADPTIPGGIRVGYATSVVVVNSTTITCLMPAMHANQASVVYVVDKAGNNASIGYSYQAPAAPTVTSVSPTDVPSAAGSLITITGTGFILGATVTVGGFSCTSVQVLSSTTITAITPNIPAVANAVRVTNPDGQFGSLAASLTGHIPSVTSVSPNLTPQNTMITVGGNWFINPTPLGVNHLRVVINGQDAVIEGVTLTTITAILNPGTIGGPFTVQVINPDTQSATASAITISNPAGTGNPPTFSSSYPGSGPISGGTFLTIKGISLLDAHTVVAVYVGGVLCTNFVLISPSVVTAFTGPITVGGKYDVWIVDDVGQVGRIQWQFIYIGLPPSISDVNPKQLAAGGGTIVTITGKNFQQGVEPWYAAFDDTYGFHTWIQCTFINETTLQVVAPFHAYGNANMWLGNNQNQDVQYQGTLTYVTLTPTLTAISATHGTSSGGTAVTLTGTNFAVGAFVDLVSHTADGIPVTTRAKVTNVYASNTKIDIVTNPFTQLPTMNVCDILVTNPDGPSVLGASSLRFTYDLTPSVLSVSPARGVPGVGTAFTVSGTYFITGATVKLGGVACTSVVFVDAQTLTAISPHSAAGTVDVLVTNPDGQTSTLVGGWLFALATPTVTSLTPTSGLFSGGTPVTITGTGFVNGALVYFDGYLATSIVFGSATSITCSTPGHPGGLADVIVTNPDGQSGRLYQGFGFTLRNNPPTEPLIIDMLDRKTGVRLGSGPLTTATQWTASDRLDRVGDFRTFVALIDPQIMYLDYHIELKAYYLLGAIPQLVGHGIVESINIVAGSSPTMYELSGPNLLGELSRKNVRDLTLAKNTTGGLFSSPVVIGPNVTSLTPLDVHWIKIDASGYGGRQLNPDKSFLSGSYVYLPAFFDNSLATNVFGFGGWHYIYVAYEKPFTAINFILGATHATSVTFKWRVQYFDGTKWNDAAGVFDGTCELVNFSGSLGYTGPAPGHSMRNSGQISWQLPSDWVQVEQVLDASAYGNEYPLTAYWVRLIPTGIPADGDATSNADVQEITIDGLVPTDGALAQIMTAAPAWTIDTTVAGRPTTIATNVFMQIQNESVLSALIKLSEATDEHFRLGNANGGRSVEWLGKALAFNGIYAERATGVPNDYDTNPQKVIIKDMKRSADTKQLVTRIIPYGSGHGTSRVDLSKTTRTIDFAKQSGAIPYTANYELDLVNNMIINHDAELRFDEIDVVQTWTNIAPLSLANIDQSRAADQLFDTALTYLLHNSQETVTIDVTVVALSTLIRPGDLIFFAWQEWDDERTLPILDLSQYLIILEIGTTLGSDGLLMQTLKLAQFARWPMTDTEIMLKLLVQDRQDRAYNQAHPLDLVHASASFAQSGASIYASASGGLVARQVKSG